jgi:hypothetical protein
MTIRSMQLQTIFRDFHFNGFDLPEGITKEQVITIIVHDGSPYLIYWG